MIEFNNASRPTMSEAIAMLAEKFFLLLETHISHASDDQPAIVISMAPHIPIKLPVSQALAAAPPLADNGRVFPILAR
jgi:hypothetical protein